ncbi:hypothetical protein H6G89_03335 [Oscillatoria sp. FACHB-1407]|uniref:hypothetical protein n=1 Tax=Oscillatoria sp. FACHB-1407 TaxID=2692847 RepID=UPI0016859F5C|nr:hypothetical protein [Oscillatoria sp. FACHB-1407]MBD2460070.1 hypothetical protein [Oscillatoria sp. FACHB-1407]
MMLTTDQPLYSKNQQPIDSEHYRQLLVRDGERRFREWHTAFVQYQKEFLRQLEQSRQR